MMKQEESTSNAPSIHKNTGVYFSFKEYLTVEEAESFFQWPHAKQVQKVTQYLNFLAEQPAAAQFTTSTKASISFAVHRQHREQDEQIDPTVLMELLEGKTRSGFGAFGTEEGFLPQKVLSLEVANVVEEIGHTYIVERNKRGEICPPVLNSRSFFFYWCHAEKQKIMDIRRKLHNYFSSGENVAPAVVQTMKNLYWQEIVVVVDRAMCLDCIQFARCFSCAEGITLYVQDPAMLRIFPPSKTEEIQELPMSPR